MNYYRRYVGDYLKKTIRLSPTEHGVYGLLLDYYYAEEKPVPLEMDEVHVICRAVRPDDRKAVQKVLAAYFTEASDGWHNERADEEIAAAVQARENGKHGGRPITGIKTGRITETLSGKQTAVATGTGHPPTTNHQPPSFSLQPSTSTQGQKRSPATPSGENGSGATIETWNAYSNAYQKRYGVEPVRNAAVNGQLAQLVKRIGAAESPAVAAFYVTHNKQVYVSRKHPTKMLLQDAEGLRTEWATGRAGTETEARNADRTAATGNVFTKLIDEAKS